METRIDKIINWFNDRIGKVLYSMEYRTGRILMIVQAVCTMLFVMRLKSKRNIL